MTARTADIDELDPPDPVFTDPEAFELLRFWVAHGEDHVRLRVGVIGPLDREPEIWGSIVADIAKHAVRALAQGEQDHGNPDEIIARLPGGFRERLSQTPDLSGAIDRALN